MKTSKTIGAQRDAAMVAVGLARALCESGKNLGGVNVLAPDLQVHVHIGYENNGLGPSDDASDHKVPLAQIDLTKLSKPTLMEIGFQICLVCQNRYDKTRESRPLPCGHHFCVPCVMG